MPRMEPHTRSRAAGAVHAFRWKVDQDGYDLSADGKQIVRRMGRLAEYAPDAEEPSPHMLFARLPRQILRSKEETAVLAPADSPLWAQRFPDEKAALLAFVNRFGFLSSTEAKAEPIDYLDRQLGHFAIFFDFGYEDPATAGIAERYNKEVPPQMTLHLEPVPGEGRRTRRGGRQKYRIRVLPQTLGGWLWVRVAEDIEAGVLWRNCGYCRKPIDAGGRYRSMARFCSDSCRATFNKLSREQKRERIERAKS